MTAADDIRASVRPRPALYFYLSYARHAPPLTATRQSRPERPSAPEMDYWVGKLFEDLSEAVRLVIRAGSATVVGYCDAVSASGADWTSAQTQALSDAEVFVPLYSPRYLVNQWPLRERESFRNRLAVAAKTSYPDRHVMPVLWNPFPFTDTYPEIGDALKLAGDVKYYADNGLHGMCMSNIYSAQYRTIVQRLASRIVDVAEHFPLGHSPAPAVGDVTVPGEHGEAPYVITVAAPAADDDLSGVAAGGYGRSRAHWRPFPDAQRMPIAQYVATVAERLGLVSRVADVVGERELRMRSPGVLLIDPWILAVDGGDRLLAESLRDLPSWVTPLVVLGGPGTGTGERGEDLRVRVNDMLRAAGIDRRWQVDSFDEFVWRMPRLVDEARRQFLRHGPIEAFDGPPSVRPRLTEQGNPTSPRWQEGTR